PAPNDAVPSIANARRPGPCLFASRSASSYPSSKRSRSTRTQPPRLTRPQPRPHANHDESRRQQRNPADLQASPTDLQLKLGDNSGAGLGVKPLTAGL